MEKKKVRRLSFKERKKVLKHGIRRACVEFTSFFAANGITLYEKHKLLNTFIAQIVGHLFQTT